MDQSWLFEDEEVEESEAISSEEEEKTEVEERLYSIVHHNDLSQPLPSDLAKHYDIQTTENGEIDIILKNSLEELHSEECEKVDNILANHVTNNTETQSDPIIVVSPENYETGTSSLRKKFRYSDVNIDNLTPKSTKETKSIEKDYINYFKYGPGVFKRKNKRFLDIKIPSKFKPSDWKNEANKSFLGIGNLNYDVSDKKWAIISQMTSALSNLNPNQSLRKLTDFASVLYQRNSKLHRRKMRLEMRRLQKISQLVDCDLTVDSTFDLSQEIKSLGEKIRKSRSLAVNADTPDKEKNRNKVMGSISLNISPFRPTENAQVVDLSSDSEEEANSTRDKNALQGSLSKTPKKSRNDEEASLKKDTDALQSSFNKTPKKSTKNRHLPKKWTKEMVEFYSTPTKSKLFDDLDTIINKMRKSTTPKDWQVDPRDTMGFYDRKKGKNRKCFNCFKRDHTTQNCPEQAKIPTCSLCGEFYHTYYCCPYKICLKCGVPTVNQGYEDECSSCYYSQFDVNVHCEVCGDVTHRSENCPDLWRSYHATTSGPKVVPDRVKVNERKYCCNCAEKGHFSHECPFSQCYGQQISPFIRNYSAEPLQKGVIDIAVPRGAYNFNSYEGDQFLQRLADSTQAIINTEDHDFNTTFQISGTFQQCNKVKNLIEEFVNTRKRKRCEPPQFYRKRQKIRK